MAAKRGRRKNKHEDSPRVVDGRAHYLVQCIRDQPWLDGEWGRLATLCSERFAVSYKTAEKAVARCYEMLEETRLKAIPTMVGYLDRTHRRTIELGHRTGDGRIITPAAAELRKMYGVGEPDKLQLSGGTTSTLRTDDANLLGALKLTNAQRLAEIDKLEKELGQEASSPANSPVVAVGSARAVSAPITSGPDQEIDDDDD